MESVGKGYFCIMKLFFSVLTFVALLTFIVASCTKENAETKYKKVVAFCDTVTYNKSIKPIILTNCAVPACHDTVANGHGDFRTFGGLQPFLPQFDNRVLIVRDMPQGGFLKPEDLSVIECWSNAGHPNN
jgi:hypothetical protein